jgi:hypothetical protein
MKHHFENNGRPNRLSITAILLLTLLSTFSGQITAAQGPTAEDVATARNHVNKGNYLLTHQQFQAALTEYQEALDSEPTNAVAKANIVLVHNNWGILYFHQRKYEEARNQWNESLKLSPNDRNAKNNLLVLKATLAKMPPPQAKPANPAASGGTGDVAADSSEADAASGAVKLNASDANNSGAAKAPGAQSAQEDNRGVVILSQPSANANSSISNTDAAAMSTSGASIMSSPSGNSSAPPITSEPASPPGSATANSINSNPAAAKPNTSIYSNAMTTNGGNSPSPFTANPLQSVGNRNAEAVTGTSNNDFAPAPAPAPIVPAAHVNASSLPTFATTPVSLTSLEATLGEIEVKVYGSSKKDQPIMQRVEKLEQDTNSKVGTGGITDRIQALAKTYGI